MKKNLINKITLLTLVGSLLLTGCGQKNEENKKIKIGITQIVEYSALDENRQGFLKALEDNGYKSGENTDIDFQNAQGDLSTAQTIAQNFASQNKDLIFAISTTSAQGTYNATKKIPILISSVTDPVSAGLVNSLENPGNNVSGTSDYIPVGKQLELVKTFIPSARNIGVIYNTSEANSKVQIDELKQNCKKYGYKVIDVGVTSTNDVNNAIESLLNKIDVLYAPTDQLVVSSMPIIVKKTLDKKIPIIASEKGSVELGALSTCGINYYKLGYQTGEMAAKVLQGSDISKMAIRKSEQMDIIVNEDSLKALSLNKPNKENIIYIKTK